VSGSATVWLRAAAGIAITLALLGILVLWRPSGLYLWLKAAHVVAVIAWMAGMLYLPRLFVYHCEAEPGSKQSETFKVMERRLLRYITTPAMLASWVLGLALAFSGVIDWPRDGWFHAKLILVVALSAYHGALAKWTRDFALDRNAHSARFYRIANEVPTLLMIGIVILAIVRPF
jgi:putative membrane protein